MRNNFVIEPSALVSITPRPNTPRNDRLFYVMPNYLTVESQDEVQLLSAADKFKFSAKTMTDPVTVSFLGALALIGQAENTDPSYGQSLRGYGKRYSTRYANTGISTLMTASVFPTVLHQDPRYFQLGAGGVKRRLMYSASRIFLPIATAARFSSTTPRLWATPSPLALPTLIFRGPTHAEQHGHRVGHRYFVEYHLQLGQGILARPS